MAEPQKVYFCDECNRVVAKENSDGKIVIVQRHGGAYHQTLIEKASLAK